MKNKQTENATLKPHSFLKYMGVKVIFSPEFKMRMHIASIGDSLKQVVDSLEALNKLVDDKGPNNIRIKFPRYKAVSKKSNKSTKPKRKAK